MELNNKFYVYTYKIYRTNRLKHNIVIKIGSMNSQDNHGLANFIMKNR